MSITLYSLFHEIFLEGSSNGIVYCLVLYKQTGKHIHEFMGEQGVTDICRIKFHPDGELKLTNTFVFTFNTWNFPSIVKFGFHQATVDVVNVKCGRQAL